jgi:hypothetical protein
MKRTMMLHEVPVPVAVVAVVVVVVTNERMKCLFVVDLQSNESLRGTGLMSVGNKLLCAHLIFSLTIF